MLDRASENLKSNHYLTKLRAPPIVRVQPMNRKFVEVQVERSILSDKAKIIKKNSEDDSDGPLPLPELELTLSGLQQPSWFGQIVNSGLNLISGVTGSTSSRNAEVSRTVADDKQAEYSEDSAVPKAKANKQEPKSNSNFQHKSYEFTNVRNAVKDFGEQTNKQQERGFNRNPQIVFRQVQKTPKIGRKAIIALILLILFAVTIKILDKKYNIQEVFKELQDPDKTKLRKKMKKMRIDE